MTRNVRERGPMPPASDHRKYPKGLATRDRIIRSAIPLFATHGFDAITMTDVAEACGISKSGLYAHYRTKRDLFVACLDCAFGALEKGPPPPPEPHTPTDELRNYVHWMVTELAANDSARRLFLKVLPEASEDVVQHLVEGLFRRTFEHHRRLIAAVNPHMDPTDVGFAIFSVALMDSELSGLYRRMTGKKRRRGVNELTDLIMEFIQPA